MEHNQFCNCSDCILSRNNHMICSTCHCLMGHGCPHSQPCNCSHDLDDEDDDGYYDIEF